jgi:hypothetical protein
MTPITALLGQWSEYGGVAIIALLALAALALIAALYQTTKRAALRAAAAAAGKDTPTGDNDLLSNLVTGMILILTAEGMFWVLTTKLAQPLPWWLAIFVCAVAEGLMVNFFRLAKTFNRTHGRPGPFGTAFWIVALAEGAIVALASTNIVEIALRILLPLGVALLHWIKLTAENSKTPSKITWLITPKRLLARLGWIKPGEESLTVAETRRMEARLVRAAYLYASVTWFSGLRGRRLRKMMLKATPEMANRVIDQLRLAYSIEARVTAVVAKGGTDIREALGTTPDPITTPSTTPPPARTTRIIDGTTTTTPRVNGHTVLAAASRRTVTATLASVAQRDAAIVADHWDALIGLREAGTLSRSAIERICTTDAYRVTARPAARILALVEVAAELDPDATIEDRIAKAIQIINNRDEN